MYEQVNGAKLYYEEYGSGKRYILACINILDPDRKGWPYDLVQEGYHVFILQMRGYGYSQHIYENFENPWYDIWAEDACQFARQKGIERFLYTGLSDGAGIGWHLCLHHAEMLVGFAGISAGPHSRTVGRNGPTRQRDINSANEPDILQRWALYHRQRILAYARRFQDDPELKKEFEEKAEKIYQYQLQRGVEEMKIDPGIPLACFTTDQELLEAVRRFTTPILLLNGMKDALLPISRTISVARDIPGVKVVTYQDGGNGLQYDHREEVHREISWFADRVFSKMNASQ